MVDCQGALTAELQAELHAELHARGWTLASLHPEFVQQVEAELLNPSAGFGARTADAVKRATVRCYARILYRCSGEDGTPQQQTAFRELWAYLFPRALFRLHHRAAAEDATQQALARIYEKRMTCRQPGSFLRWCDQILVRLVTDEHRAHYAERLTAAGVEYERHEVELYDRGDMVNEESTPQGQEVADPTQDTPHAALTAPMRAALIAALRECLENERQVTVVGELFINDKTFLEVAEELQTTPLNVQVIRSRALKKLRDCENMQQLVEDWDV